MKRLILFALVFISVLTSCELEEMPVTSVSKEAIFSTEDGLKTYSYSFYNALPTGSELHYLESTLTDFGATSSLNTYITLNAFNQTNTSGWSWTVLRNINYFIANCTDESIDEDVRNNYLGLAKFFRAWFYYEKVRRFGDVPWIDKPLDVDDAELYAARDSREVVMENVYNDLLFACSNITASSDATGSMVTKWVAYALASRVCLFEGTYRKYHSLNLETTADTWLQRAAESAGYIMAHSGKSLYTSSGSTKSYRALFTNDAPVTDEILMAVCSSADLGVYHDANWKWTSATYGTRLNFIRPFVNTYLQLDGTPYTSRGGWETETFYEECQNRDYRLAQTIRTPGYMREGKIALPDYAGYALLGYQPIKLCIDATTADTKSLNTNALPLFRYAEVLLNYAEAKAEMGTITDNEWSLTIGALRERAGITGGTKSKPTTIDTYLQENYFPSVNDPVILEIRRERAIELSLEGFRFDDLRRWKCGELLKMSWYGIFIPEVNTALDMDNNGTPDVIYYTSSGGLAAAKAAIDWATYSSTCAVVSVTTDKTSGKLQIIEVEENTPSAGYYITWNTQNDNKRVWGDKQYLYPIPALVIVKNPNILQNAGWEDGASNDGN